MAADADASCFVVMLRVNSRKHGLQTGQENRGRFVEGYLLVLRRMGSVLIRGIRCRSLADYLYISGPGWLTPKGGALRPLNNALTGVCLHGSVPTLQDIVGCASGVQVLSCCPSRLLL